MASQRCEGAIRHQYVISVERTQRIFTPGGTERPRSNQAICLRFIARITSGMVIRMFITRIYRVAPRVVIGWKCTPRNCRHMHQRQADDIADILRVDPRHQSRHQHHPYLLLLTAVNDSHLFIEQLTPANLFVETLVVCSVKLQENGGQPRSL